MISRKSVDDVINAAVIEEVVGDYIALKKRGANLLGRCPFHDEKTPSFTVSPTKGIYKCFGCGKAGNSVSFLMEHDSLSFADAIRKLASKYHITLEEDTLVNREEYDEQQKKRENLLVALDFANKYFIDQLHNSDEGRVVGDTYFRERGFTRQTIDEFQLGYSPQGWTSLVDAAKAHQFNLSHFADAGLIKKREDDTYFDLFRHRVIFPIHDLTGKVIAFGGRQLVKDEKSPKYLNSPETEVYHKSHVLYGIFQSKKAIKTLNNCFLVEGYTDVITLHQSDVKNVVASSGTSLTEGQIKLIKRFTDNVTVLYDGDAAGIKASLRGIDLLLEQGLNVRTVSFPEGEDPDSYCKHLGPAEFKKYLQEQEKDFILFKTDLLMAGVGNDPIRKTEVVKNLLTSISLIPDALKRAAYARECSRLMDTDEKLLLVEINKLRKNKHALDQQPIPQEIQEILHTKTDLPPQELYSGGDEQEMNLIRLLIQSGHKKFMEDATVADFVFKELKEDDALKIVNPVYQKVLDEVTAIMEHELDFNEQFFVNHEDAEIRKMAADFLTEQHELSSAWSDNGIIVKTEKENYVQDLQSLFLFLKKSKLEQLIKANLEDLQHAEEDEKRAFCLHYHIQLTEVRNTISEMLGTVVN
ncbi:MAG: DNA primase [Bacteroidetes bacterium]|nr:DNA primase [Bacteroidota bacterium]